MSCEFEKAIKVELELWPDVTVEFAQGGRHPKAKLSRNGKMLAVSYSGTPSDGAYGMVKMLGDIRRAAKSLGAVRDKPAPKPEDEEKEYRPANDGKKAREMMPARAEPIKTGPTMATQLVAVAKEAGIDREAEKPADQEIAQLLMPKVELRLGAGIYDLLTEEYHGDPAAEPSLSASLAKIQIAKSPRHAWEEHPRLNPNYEREDLMKFRVGSAFHSTLLGKGAPIAEFSHNGWRTNAAKADRDAALAEGYIPLLTDAAAKVRAMASAAYSQMRGREELAYAMAGGQPEKVYIWQEETKFGPIFCRMMVDWTPHSGRYFVDWKTTGVGAFNDWGQKTMWDTGCDIQDAFYRRGFKAHGMDFDACLFAVIEDSEPHAMMTHRVDHEAQEEADKEVEWAINNFAMCLHSKHWPMYPLALAWQAKPAWRVNRHAERRAMGGQMIDQEYHAAYMQMLADTRAENEARGPIDLPWELEAGVPQIENGEGS